jgi:hypothetical protein
MLLGRFSGEWIALAVILTVAAIFVGGRTAEVHPAWALLLSLGVYGFLRRAGRTPIGITYANSSAARGHPVLSLIAAIVITAVALRSALSSLKWNQ